jgi:mannosyltransferase
VAAVPDAADRRTGLSLRSIGPMLRSRSRAFWGTLVLTAFALAIREYRIDEQSLWLDELFSAVYVRKGLHYILTEGLGTETNPPLYYVLLRGWTALFGDGAVALRTLSAVLGALTVPVLVAIGRRIASARAGLVAALLFSLAAYQIEYAQEARTFTLTCWALSLALLGLVRVIAEAPVRPPQLSAGLLFAAGITAAVYSHFTAIFYWLAIDLSLAAMIALSVLRQGGVTQWRPVLLRWTGYNLIALVATAPALYQAFALRNAEQIAWISHPSRDYLVGMIKVLVFTPLVATPWPLMGTVVALAAIAWSVVATRRQPRVVLMAIAALLSLMTLTGVSELRPVLMPRTSLWVPVPIYLLVGCAIAGIATPWLRRSALGAAVAFEVLTAVLHLPEATKEPWRDAIAQTAPLVGADDLVVALRGAATPALLYYWPGGFDAGRCRRLTPPAASAPAATVFPECSVEISAKSLLDQVGAGRGAWLIATNIDVRATHQAAKTLAKTMSVKEFYGDARSGGILIVHLIPPK